MGVSREVHSVPSSLKLHAHVLYTGFIRLLIMEESFWPLAPLELRGYTKVKTKFDVMSPTVEISFGWTLAPPDRHGYNLPRVGLVWATGYLVILSHSLISMCYFFDSASSVLGHNGCAVSVRCRGILYIVRFTIALNWWSTACHHAVSFKVYVYDTDLAGWS